VNTYLTTLSSVPPAIQTMLQPFRAAVIDEGVEVSQTDLYRGGVMNDVMRWVTFAGCLTLFVVDEP
jgi:hypothetical protein